MLKLFSFFRNKRQQLLHWQIIPEYLLLSAWAVQILAEFKMTNHFHRFPDSNTLPAKLIQGAARDKQGGGGAEGCNGRNEIERAALREIEALQMTQQEFILQNIQSIDRQTDKISFICLPSLSDKNNNIWRIITTTK
ncbi:hypothetical protein ILYODFUR_037204 [Ilyodon furcidens]|uniref:Uncharacterized protein n=1 Tax=Ilyodon furcidens TaxID=33524 RepID=A0ABV0TQ04_9TELE